ncbi:MAG: Vir protein, partial [Salinivirgaceae bacterium]
MKKLTTILLILAIAISTAMAQAPQQFKYQAVLRDSDGAIMANESVTVAIDILQGSTSGSSVFSESHEVTTTAQGIINLNIGSQADLSAVDWSVDDYFIQITVNGTVMGTSQLLSVPYAQFAEAAGNTFSG